MYVCMTRDSKIHKDVPQPEISNNRNFKCYICERKCKTKADRAEDN